MVSETMKFFMAMVVRPFSTRERAQNVRPPFDHWSVVSEGRGDSNHRLHAYVANATVVYVEHCLALLKLQYECSSSIQRATAPAHFGHLTKTLL